MFYHVKIPEIEYKIPVYSSDICNSMNLEFFLRPLQQHESRVFVISMLYFEARGCERHLNVKGCQLQKSLVTYDLNLVHNLVSAALN